MAWRQKKVEDQRQYLVTNYLEKTATMKDLCKEFGVSRKTGHKWVQRYLEEGVDALKDRSKAPKEASRKYDNEAFSKALELKVKHPSFGPKKIHAMLQRSHPDRQWPCPTRLYEVFKKHYLVSSRKLRRRVPRTHPLTHANESNAVWCADFKGWFRTGNQQKVEPLTITDGHSRFLIRCQHMDRKRTEDVWKVYESAFEQYGLPARIRTDNGPPFATTGPGRLSPLTVLMIKAGITPEWIEPGHPEQNGRHERFHRSLKAAIATPPSFTMEEQELRMRVFIDEYNFERPHEALNQQTPGSLYAPSTRIWDGVLRSPEYDTQEEAVRKVCPNGCIHWKRKACYVGQLLAGEYVGLHQVKDGEYVVHYGPVVLGHVIEGQGFSKPARKPSSQGKTRNVTHVSELCHLSY